MTKLIIRHGLSEANDRTSAAFGLATAPLKPEGVLHGIEVGTLLKKEYGITPNITPVATSTMLRSQQTAQAAGFLSMRHYAILNEVDIPKTPELRAHLTNGIVVDAAKAAAEQVLLNPPEEPVWVSHGYLIAALCRQLGIDTSDKRFIPHFGEIRELPID